MNKEIEKAKEDLSFMNEGDYITKEMSDSARVLEGYIKQLENEIETYKDFKEIANMKMGDRNVIRAIKKYKTLDKSIEEAYWKGYIQKQKEDVEICKICKYRKKSETLSKVTNKLKEDIEIYKNSKELTQKERIELDYAQEILNIIRGDDI